MTVISFHIPADAAKAEAVQHHPDGCCTQLLRLYADGMVGPVALVSVVWPPGVPPSLTTSFSPPHRGPHD